MIVKFDGVEGHALAKLLMFIHSDENTHSVENSYEKRVVQLKAIVPSHQVGGTWYDLTLQILEWIVNKDLRKNVQVDPKYWLKVYQILGEKEEKTTSEPTVPVAPQEWRHLDNGTRVKTTRENPNMRGEWHTEALKTRRWGVIGTIIMHNDSYGLSYEVRHQDDGTIGHYDPSELEVLK